MLFLLLWFFFKGDSLNLFKLLFISWGECSQSCGNPVWITHLEALIEHLNLCGWLLLFSQPPYLCVLRRTSPFHTSAYSFLLFPASSNELWFFCKAWRTCFFLFSLSLITSLTSHNVFLDLITTEFLLFHFWYLIVYRLFGED